MNYERSMLLFIYNPSLDLYKLKSPLKNLFILLCVKDLFGSPYLLSCEVPLLVFANKLMWLIEVARIGKCVNTN